jgi:hypothetical protein
MISWYEPIRVKSFGRFFCTFEPIFASKFGGHIPADIHDQIAALEVDADFVVALADNGRDDLGEEIPKGGFKIFFD